MSAPNNESKVVVVDGQFLTVEDVIRVSRDKYLVEISEDAYKKVNDSRNKVEELIKIGDPIYGLNTGFGSLCDVTVSEKDLDKLQENLIVSHSVGVGSPYDEEVVRGAMLLRVNTLLQGFSGIRIEVIEMIVKLLNERCYPYIPQQGSVGCSGDLAPLSHLCLALMGKGEVIVKNERIPSLHFLQSIGQKPLVLKAKEGLAFNNGTPFMTAVAALAVYDAENLFIHANLAASLSLQALSGISDPFDAKVHNARPHRGQIFVAKAIRDLIKDSSLIDADNNKVQDSYSLRTIPQVHGASWDAINYVKGVVSTEINSATDNPLIFDRAYSAGNFHGQPIALACDFLCIAVSELANISERRTNKLLDKNCNSGLPSFLIKKPGLNSGFMMVQYTAAALVSENKVLSHPASVDSIPTCANQEDHVSMGSISSRKARSVVENSMNVVAIELFCGAQAIEEKRSTPSTSSKKIVSTIREIVPNISDDCIMYPYMHSLKELIDSEKLRNYHISVPSD